jgi:hypothetical protein
MVRVASGRIVVLCNALAAVVDRIAYPRTECLARKVVITQTKTIASTH